MKFRNPNNFKIGHRLRLNSYLSRLIAALSLVAVSFLGFGDSAHQESELLKHLPEGYELVYEQDFEQEDCRDQVVCSDENAWRITSSDDRNYLELFQASDYQPPQRSPLNLALLRLGKLENFVLDLDMIQSGREYGHRDLCLFWGVQDKEHYYYVHMASKGDENAHQVFIVDGEARKPITISRTEGVKRGEDEWHHVRLVRDSEAGTIQVFFDDMETPIMKANDRTFGAGFLGVGSFDDTGGFDNIKIWSPEIALTECEVFVDE